MIYFKKVQLAGNEKQLLETAMRKVAIKRMRSLDFTSAEHNMGSEKLFLGLDNNKDVKFTRLHTSLEKFFPKIIISFPKDETISGYRLRLGVFPTWLFAFLAMGLFATGFSALINQEDYEAMAAPIVFLGIFILLTWFELKIVDRHMKRAVERYEREN